MSAFNPVSIFKDISELKIFSRVFLRKLLVVVQFIFAVVSSRYNSHVISSDEILDEQRLWIQ
jgi:hypothetical protein